MKTRLYDRLLVLKDRIDKKEASHLEKKEYMQLLLEDGRITQKQYDQFLSNQNSDQILDAALTIGGVMLVTWLITKLVD
ncbi:MAG: hypothetical protein HKN39_06805 [Flavobacteriales bacterium]|nr:hypothetical protein [Flavobacteriales bacterium]